jgi:transcriptional regulator with XRE-family HTH domain
MGTTLATVEAREVLRCDFCSLVQFRTSNSLCRRCRKPLEIDDPEPLSPQLVTGEAQGAEQAEGIDVARAVREVRHDRCLSQRQLAGRMQVPRTYISKIENGKAVPTLSSLQRLASALEVGICDLLRDGQSRRAREAAAVLADPFLSEIAPLVLQLDPFQRSMFLSQVREMSGGRRRSA